jgi:subtilisin family serine protease
MRLAMEWQPEGFLKSAARERQRTNIANAVRVFVARHRLREATTQSYHTLPFIELTADASLLEELLASDDVLGIELNGTGHPGLMDSAHIVGSDTAATQGHKGNGQRVVIIDSGVEATHPFLAGKVVAEACFSGRAGPGTSLCPNGQLTMIGAGAGAPCPSSLSGCGHGTHVAGIVAGKNGTPPSPNPTIQSIARDASIIAIQVMSRGAGTQCTPYQPSPCAAYDEADLRAALDYVTFSLVDPNNPTIAAVNLSLSDHMNWGTRANCNAAKFSLRLTIKNVTSFGVAVTGITGNEAYLNGTSSPGCVSEVLEVGATMKNDTVAGFSSSAADIDFLAPGDGYSANTGILSSVVGGGYNTMWGTSMAAPHVAGAIAILRAMVPTAPVEYLRHLLAITGSPVTDARNGVSKPRLNIVAALNQIITDTQAPSAPSNLTATTVTTSSATIAWTASTDNDAVAYYQVSRRPTVNDDWQFLGRTSVPQYSDTGLMSNTAFQYRVEAFDYWANVSSATMVVTAMQFTDALLLVGETEVRAVHVTELRSAVNAVRTCAGLTQASWTNTVVPGSIVQAVDVQELRDRLAPALTALGITAPSYTDTPLASGITIKKAHISEVRRNVN